MSERVWSGEQQAIFSFFRAGRGNLIVRARAGASKTTSILEGINHAPEASILLAAFNKSIAVELTSRLQNPRAEAKTLHSLGFGFIRRAWNGVKVDDRGERGWDLARRAAGEQAPDPITKAVKEIHSKVREIDPFAKEAGILAIASKFDLLPDAEWAKDGWDDAKVVSTVAKALIFAKERTPVIDFADMVFLPLANNWVRAWFDLVVVDEAQDMTQAQLAIAQRSCRSGGRLVLVGDDRQAIYGFRGADSGSLDRLKAELHATELTLTTTYRCPKVVVALAAEIVPDFKAAANAPQGEIKRCGKDEMIATAREGDFILSRTNAPLASICLALLRAGVRARIKGRDIGAGILALLKKLRVRDLSALPVKLEAWKATEIKRAAKLGDAAEDRIAFVCDQVELLSDLCEGLGTVSELEVRLRTLFTEDAEHQAVCCSSVHKAKGLEASKVYLLEGTFRKGSGSEESNIRYVAITRSKGTLVWVSGFEKARRGE